MIFEKVFVVFMVQIRCFQTKTSFFFFFLDIIIIPFCSIFSKSKTFIFRKFGKLQVCQMSLASYGIFCGVAL